MSNQSNEHSIDPTISRAVYDRDGWHCRVCKSRQNLHPHHIIFRSHGGEDTPENLVTLCFRCHGAVHARKLFILTTDANDPLKLEFHGYIPGVS